MDAYYDVKLLPCNAMNSSRVMGTVITRLHMLFDTLPIDDIGISFPQAVEQYKTLGYVLRLHGTRDRLEQFVSLNPFSPVAELVRLGEIADVPEQVEWRMIRRVQCRKSNVERVRRRHASRHNLTMEQVREKIKSSVQRRLDLPFAIVHSASSKQKFPLFIEQRTVEEPGTGHGTFNTYGLSRERAVPWF